MTEPEIREEKRYRKDERLGILCGAAMPTPAQRRLAQREADEWEARETGTPLPKEKP